MISQKNLLFYEKIEFPWGDQQVGYTAMLSAVWPIWNQDLDVCNPPTLFKTFDLLGNTRTWIVGCCKLQPLLRVSRIAQMHGDRCALEHTGGANQIHFLLWWWSLPALVGNNRVKGRYWMSVTKLNILTSYTPYTHYYLPALVMVMTSMLTVIIIWWQILWCWQ